MDVMKRLGILIGGAVFMVPAIPAATTYLNRLGPKPLSFQATHPPREQVMRMLPPLNTDLPPKETAAAEVRPDLPTVDVTQLWPVPADPQATTSMDEFPGLPGDWIERLFGPPRPSEGGPDGSPSTDPYAPNRRQLRPEDLVPFFTTPGSQNKPSIVVPVPFIPGIPGSAGSSRASFSQE